MCRSPTRRELVSNEIRYLSVASVGNSRRRAGYRKLSRKSPSIAESHAPEIFADEFVMLSRKIQKPPAGNPSPLAPGYPGRPCIDFCPMEYRDTHPLTTSRASLHPRSPLFVTRPLRSPLAVLHQPLTRSLSLFPSACPSIAIFNTRVRT